MIVTNVNATEYEVHRFATEASTLGFPPGRWPTELPTSLGNGRPFYFERFEQDGGVAVYKQELGCLLLRVYND